MAKVRDSPQTAIIRMTGSKTLSTAVSGHPPSFCLPSPRLLDYQDPGILMPQTKFILYEPNSLILNHVVLW